MEAAGAILLGLRPSPGPSRERRNDMTPATTAADPHDDPYENSLHGARAWFAQKGLTRPREGRLIAGVVLLTPLLYLPLWVLMPKDA
jgi:hypothetical protein